MTLRSPGTIFLRYQRRWIEDPAQVKVIAKGRRIGISYAEAADSVLHAAAQGAANVYYISYDKEMTQGFIEDCAGWARAFNAAAGEIEESVIEDDDRQILTYAIEFDSGHRIQTFSSAPRKLRSKGRPGERVIIDEAAFVPDLAGLLKAAMAITIWGGHVRIISTHNGDDNPFHELVTDIRAGRLPYSLHTVDLDQALADGLFRRICAVTGQAWSPEAETAWRAEIVALYKGNEDEELFCIPRAGTAAYFPRALIESRMVPAPVIRFTGDDAFNAAPEPARAVQMADWIREELVPFLGDLDRGRRHVLGMDFARKGHMSAIAPMEIGATLGRRVPIVAELKNVPHRQQQQVLFALGDRLPRLAAVAIDAGGPGSYIAEAAVDHWGSIVEPLHLTERWYREHMPRHKARFEDGGIEIPLHDDLVDDYRAWRLVRGVPRLPDATTDAHGERHGDASMAIALADYASVSDAAPIEFASTGVRRMGADLDDAGDAEPIRAGVGFGTVGGRVHTGGWQ